MLDVYCNKSKHASMQLCASSSPGTLTGVHGRALGCVYWLQAFSLCIYKHIVIQQKC